MILQLPSYGFARVRQDYSHVQPAFVSSGHCAQLVGMSVKFVENLAKRKAIRSYPLPSASGAKFTWRFIESEFLEDIRKLAENARATL